MVKHDVRNSLKKYSVQMDFGQKKRSCRCEQLKHPSYISGDTAPVKMLRLKPLIQTAVNFLLNKTEENNILKIPSTSSLSRMIFHVYCIVLLNMLS